MTAFLPDEDCVTAKECLRDRYVQFHLTKARTEYNRTHPEPHEPAFSRPATASLGTPALTAMRAAFKESDSEGEDEALGFDERKHKTEGEAAFKRVWKNWLAHACCHDFGKDPLFKGQLHYLNGSKPALFDDLWQLNLIPLYEKLLKEDAGGQRFGLLPLMCLCYLGGHLSSSFEERVNSAAKQRIGDHRRSMHDENVEMETVLRINEPFMSFMMEHYPEIQQAHHRELIDTFAQAVEAEDRGQPTLAQFRSPDQSSSASTMGPVVIDQADDRPPESPTSLALGSPIDEYTYQVT